MVSRSMMVAALVVAVVMAVLAPSASAFAPRAVSSRQGSATTATTATAAPTTPTVAFMAKGKNDLSDIETRDMTREEMVRFNQLTEDKMNEELGMMTAFSAIISLPILYLFWVALFSD